MMSFSKNPVHFQKPDHFQKPVHFQKPAHFQKLRSFIKNPGFYQNPGLLSKKPGFSTETWVFKDTQKLLITHSSYASILKCLSITGESLMLGLKLLKGGLIRAHCRRF